MPHISPPSKRAVALFNSWQVSSLSFLPPPPFSPLQISISFHLLVQPSRYYRRVSIIALPRIIERHDECSFVSGKSLSIVYLSIIKIVPPPPQKKCQISLDQTKAHLRYFRNPLKLMKNIRDEKKTYYRTIISRFQAFMFINTLASRYSSFSSTQRMGSNIRNGTRI